MRLLLAALLVYAAMMGAAFLLGWILEGLSLPWWAPDLMKLVACAFVLGLVCWMLYWSAFRRRVDQRFGASVSGGRAGTIEIQVHGRKATAEFELGTRVKIVWRASFHWADGPRMTLAEATAVADVLQVWSEARRDAVEIVNDTPWTLPDRWG